MSMKTYLKKVLVLVLVLAMVLTWGVGCTPKQATPSSDASSSGESSGSSSDTGDSGKQEDSEPEAIELDPYEITYYMLCNTISEDRDKVIEKVNAITKEKINATINLVMLDWGTYKEKFNTAVNAGECVDIAFTADWWDYVNNVANNFFLPLNDPENNLLEKYAAETVKELGEGFILGSQINGISYGVPTNKEFAVNGGFVWNKDLADKYGFDMSKVNTVADLEPMLKVIKENEPNVIPYLIDQGGAMYTIPFSAFFADLGIDYSIVDDTKIQYKWERADVVDMMKVHQRYYKEGYIHKEAYTENNKYNDHLLEGDFFITQQPLKPLKGKSTELMSAAGNKFKLDEKETTPLVAVSNHAAGSMLAIPTTSEDPDRAMMFINLLHTDPGLVNLFVWGVEGVHHKVVQENPKKVAPIPGNTWTTAVLPWTLGSVFNHWLGEHEDPKKHEGFRMTKENAPHHITLGFRFLRAEEFQAEVAAINNAIAEYTSILATGAVENFDETYNKMIKAAETAGLRTVQEAVQQDLDEWLEKMGKK